MRHYNMLESHLVPCVQCSWMLFQDISADVMEELIVAGADIDRKNEKVRCIAAQLASASVAHPAGPLHDKRPTIAALNRFVLHLGKFDMTCG